MRHNLNSKRWCTDKRYGYLIALGGVMIAFTLRFSLHPILVTSLPLFFFQKLKNSNSGLSFKPGTGGPWRNYYGAAQGGELY